MKRDSPSKIQRFYRHLNHKGKGFDFQGCALNSFRNTFVEHGGDLEKLTEQYRILFGENLPETTN